MNTPDEIKRLEESDVYMAMVGKDFLSSASSIAQWEHAKTLKKPFIIIKKSWIKIPDDMLQDVNILKLIDIDKTKPQDLDKDFMLMIEAALSKAMDILLLK